MTFRAQKLLDDLTGKGSLEAMRRAQAYADSVGFSYRSTDEVLAAVKQEHAELLHVYAHDQELLAEEIADNLFVLLRLCQRLDLDPEQLLKQSTQKFLRRMVVMEEYLKAAGRDWSSVADWREVWREAKRGYASNAPADS